MATRIRDLAAVHPDGARMQVSVIAPPHEQWPLPWYLRAMPNVGYWTAPGDPVALQAPVIVAAMDHAARPRWRPRRSLRVGVLRPQARSAPGALHRARAVGAVPGPGGAGWAGTRVRGRGTDTSRHCEPALAVALWRRRACDDASRAGPGRALLQRGGPPRPRGVPAVRRDPPGRAARDGRRWEPRRHVGDPRAHARGGACGGDDAAALAAPRQGRGGAGRHPRGAGAARQRSSGSSTPTWRRRSGRSTTSWPCSATARPSSSSWGRG